MMPSDPSAAIDALAEFPALLQRVVETTPENLQRRRSAEDFFAVVEHVWHLADLEEEGFGRRIERLLAETDPELPDFRGDVIAIERRYLEQPLEPALTRFLRARESNRRRLAGVPEGDWSRSGTQELAGPVSLAGIPRAMLQHDVEHAGQIVLLLRELGLPVEPKLAAFAERRP
jgi:DinB family.